MQIVLGQVPVFVWWLIAPGALILLLAWAVSALLRSYAHLTAIRGQIKVALAALQAEGEGRMEKDNKPLARGKPDVTSVLSRFARRPSAS